MLPVFYDFLFTRWAGYEKFHLSELVWKLVMDFTLRRWPMPQMCVEGSGIV